MASKLPPRVVARPNPKDWADDALMTLEEAAALMWPQGPLTKNSLKRIWEKGGLEVTVLNRKLLVDKRALSAMAVAARRTRPSD